jgi:hypothetical protein
MGMALQMRGVQNCENSLGAVSTASVFGAKKQMDPFFLPRLREFVPRRCSSVICGRENGRKNNLKNARGNGPLNTSMDFL